MYPVLTIDSAEHCHAQVDVVDFFEAVSLHHLVVAILARAFFMHAETHGRKLVLVQVVHVELATSNASHLYSNTVLTRQ